MALLSTYRRAHAEKAYQAEIRRSTQRAVLLHLYKSAQKDGVITDAELDQLTERLSALAARMDERESVYIERALHQSSPVGRARYVDKVLKAAA
ncbi:MAG: hypothetical protein ACK4XK_09370 [Casimicrobiaceae bacterium]